MDWSNERYVRLFTRDTPEWLCWSWQSRALWPLLIRKVDRSGVLANKLGARGVAALVGLPVEVVEAGLPDLLADGCLQVHPLGYVIPNFIEAQEAPQSDKQRKRESRERRRAMVDSGLREDQRREVVYFIRAESGGPIKIGQTDDVAMRISTMQSSHPETLVLLATQPGDRAIEKRMHERFSHLRIRGEWFRADVELLAYIRGLADVTNRDSSRGVTTSHSGPDLADPDPEECSPARDPAVRAPASRERAEARRRLIGRAWTIGGEAFARVQADGIDLTAPNGWAGLPSASSPPMANLLAILDELLAGDRPDFEAAEAKIANRIAVAEAEARAMSPPSARYMTPARIWNRESFSIAVDMSPEQAAAPPRPFRRAGPRGSAERAPNRDVRVGQIQPHHPSEYNVPDGEMPL